MTLSKKQKDIISKMRDGWILLIGQSDSTGRPYFLISKGYDNIYFNATVFSNLILKELIYQENRHFDYVLTELGKTIKL